MNDKISKHDEWCKAAPNLPLRLENEVLWWAVDGILLGAFDPENNDADCFRLMADSELSVHVRKTESWALGENGREIIQGPLIDRGRDKRAATRAAICQCAEQIGRSVE